MKKIFIASASEIQSSDLFMTLRTVMFTVPSANLNGVRCSEAFLDEIVSNQEKYITIPLCADIQNLISGDYLSHCYDEETGEFHTADIGSFYKFEKELIPSGETALVGYARVQKRKRAVCEALLKLFAENSLNVSFEISVGNLKELEDGTFLIDKDESNYLEGMCVVTFPACPQATAEQLVAELKEGLTENNREEAIAMKKKEIQTAEEQIEVAEVDTDKEDNIEVAEQTVETTEQTAESENAEDIVAETVEETAEETGSETEETACDDQSKEKDDKEVCETAETQETETVKAEEETSELETLRHELSELHTELKNLRTYFDTVIAETKNAVSQLAEKKNEDEISERLLASVRQVNVFTDTITEPVSYSLLEACDEREGYSLLDCE